jgi:hypothetical protein
MANYVVAEQRIEPRTALPVKDRVIIGLIILFTAVALTLELYWLIFHQQMESRTDLFARIIALYWPADYSYRIPGYPIEKSYTLTVEAINTFLTPVLSALLIYAIFKHRPYRYALQLVIGTYTFYGTFVYYTLHHVSGYKAFEYHGAYPFLMFYLANLPWLVAYGWFACDAFRALARGEPPSPD